jgi:hypothetical protein
MENLKSHQTGQGWYVWGLDSSVGFQSPIHAIIANKKKIGMFEKPSFFTT